MVEVSTGRPPYGSVPHDEKLALAICNGLRPRVTKGTPNCYIELAYQCLDAAREKRPSAKEILEIIRNWRCHNNHNKKQVSTFKDLISKKKLKCLRILLMQMKLVHKNLPLINYFTL